MGGLFFFFSFLNYYYSFSVFNTRVSPWSFTGIWVTASLLGAPGLYWVFLMMLTLLWSRFLHFSRPFEIVQSATIIIGITVTLMIHRFFLFSGKVQVCFNLFAFFIFTLVRQKSKINFFFLLFSLDYVIACISKSKKFYVSFYKMDTGLCIYHLVVWWNLNLLHNSQLITFPTQSCFVQGISKYTAPMWLLIILLLIMLCFCLVWLYSPSIIVGF